MNRLETRVKRLEETGPGNDADEPQLFGVTRILLDQHGHEMSRGFVGVPVEALLIPVPTASEPADADDPLPEIPVLTSYRDEPWMCTREGWKDVMTLIGNKSRSL